MDALPIDIVKLIKICRENDATMVGLFGSVARGEDTSTSFLNHIPDVIKKMRMKQSRFPKGWDED